MTTSSVPAAVLAPQVTETILSNGDRIPNVGLGLGAWQFADNEETLEEAVESALRIGYRHFDTTPPNDKSIGNVLKKWLDQGKVKREELYIVSKLPLTAMWPYRVNEFIREALKSLQLDYVDLYLIQFPAGLQYVPAPAEEDQPQQTSPTQSSPPKTTAAGENGSVILEKTNLESIWRAMENEIKVGRTKAIGVCDFNREQMERILKGCSIPPAVLQMEVNVYFQRKEMRVYCNRKGVAVCAYAPLGSLDITDVDASSKELNSTHDQVIKTIARKYGRTPSQIILSFLVQSKIIVVPKCLNQFDIKSNIKVCGLKLEPEEMRAIENLDRGEDGHLTRTVFAEIFTGVENHPEYPWNNA